MRSRITQKPEPSNHISINSPTLPGLTQQPAPHLFSSEHSLNPFLALEAQVRSFLFIVSLSRSLGMGLSTLLSFYISKLGLLLGPFYTPPALIFFRPMLGWGENGEEKKWNTVFGYISLFLLWFSMMGYKNLNSNFKIFMSFLFHIFRIAKHKLIISCKTLNLMCIFM